MTGRGRPLRFLAVVMAGWVGARVVLLWPPAGSLPAATQALVPLAEAGAPTIVPAGSSWTAGAIAGRVAMRRTMQPRPAHPVSVASSAAADPTRIQMALLGLIQYGRPESGRARISALPLAAQPVTIAPMPSRWSASAWAVARPGMGMGLGAVPGTGQIGGSQAGLRLSYLLLPESHLAAFARVAAPLAGRGAEAAIGLEWQPTRAPVRLVAEQRFGLDGTKGGTGLGVIAGIDTRAPADFRLEAYGQAGAIHRVRIEPYADGAARVTRVVAEAGRLRLSLGAGAWGAAQRDAQRLDLGPSATLGVPIGGRTIRLALDWRQRVAGDARPGSGPALTIGGDF